METAGQGALAIRPFEARDEAAVLDLVRSTLRRERDLEAIAHELAVWRWRHLQSPAGTQLQLATADGGRVAAVLAAAPQLADTPNGPRRFVHVQHPLTLPEPDLERRTGELLATLGHAFASAPAHGNAFGYGMPRADAEAACRRLLGYRALGPLDYWLRPADAPLPKAAADVALRHVDAFAGDVDELWRESLPLRPCALRKDRRYLQWRYAAHPDRDEYTRVVASRGGATTGVMVLRQAHELVPGACAIADLVCRDEDDGTAMTMLREAARLAAHRGRALLAAFADHDPNAARMEVAGAHRVASANWDARFVTVRLLDDELTPELLATHWRYALGDTDLC